MKRVMIILAILVSVIVLFISIFILKIEKVDMEFVETGNAVFVYGSSNISAVLTDKDLSYITNLFDGKWIYSDNPSCGFNEDVSIRFNNGAETFCIACDTCPIIYWKEKDKYFHISEKECKKLHELLGRYGFKFPCV